MTPPKKPREFWINDASSKYAIGSKAIKGAFKVREVVGAQKVDESLKSIIEVPEIKRKECNDDLENAAERHTDNRNHVPHGKRDMPSWVYSRLDFKAGAEWQKAKDAKQIIKVEADSVRANFKWALQKVELQDKVRDQTIKEVISFLVNEEDSWSGVDHSVYRLHQVAQYLESKFLPKREDKE